MKFRVSTDIESCFGVLIELVNQPLRLLTSTSNSADSISNDLILNHPIFEYRFQYLPISKEVVDVIANPETATKLQIEFIENLRAHKGLTVSYLLYQVRRPYRLDFVSLTLPCLSEVDFNKLLIEAYVDCEFPSQTEGLDELFKLSTPELIMNSFEFKEWGTFPDKLTIYRGVNPCRELTPNGISWTLDRAKAEWFSSRLAPEGSKPVVYELVISKEHTYGYLSSRGESEILVDTDHIVDATLL